jgi:hypothetical protein
MKALNLIFGSFFVSISAFALPVITVQPTNQIVAPSNNANFSVTASGATGYQWRFNGTNIPGATSASLLIKNAQSTNTGYYMALVGNQTGWTPSQLAYLSVVPSPGASLTLSNESFRFGQHVNTSAIAEYLYAGPYGQPITNGTAQIIAGPALDQMQPVGTTTPVTNGYFLSSPVVQTIPSLAPGQTVYYSVSVSYPDGYGYTYTQQSTVLKLIAGGSVPFFPIPSTESLWFPLFPEWPEPLPGPPDSAPPTNAVLLTGQTLTLNDEYSGFGGPTSPPTLQWRKDGHYISDKTNFTYYPPDEVGIQTSLTIANVQASDAGVYDAEVLGDNWFISPKTYLSVISNTSGTQCVLRSPRTSGTNFICDLEGAPGKWYSILVSTNLSTWDWVASVSNGTGIVTITNALGSSASVYYRGLTQ